MVLPPAECDIDKRLSAETCNAREAEGSKNITTTLDSVRDSTICAVTKDLPPARWEEDTSCSRGR